MADQERRFVAPDLKPPGLIESGIFSGGDEEAEPRGFQVEKAEPAKDGSIRAYVRFRWGKPPEKPVFWRVADVFTQEDGRYLLNDVIFLKNEHNREEYRLSRLLALDCSGPHWIGYPLEK